MGHDAPLHEVIQDLEPTDITVGKLSRDRGNKHSELYGKLLLACEGDKIHFLSHLYEPYFVQDADAKIAWLALVKNGFFLDLLDPEGPKARDLVSTVQFAIIKTKDRLGGNPSEHARYRRRNR